MGLKNLVHNSAFQYISLSEQSSYYLENLAPIESKLQIEKYLLPYVTSKPLGFSRKWTLLVNPKKLNSPMFGLYDLPLDNVIPIWQPFFPYPYMIPSQQHQFLTLVFIQNGRLKQFQILDINYRVPLYICWQIKQESIIRLRLHSGRINLKSISILKL